MMNAIEKIKKETHIEIKNNFVCLIEVMFNDLWPVSIFILLTTTRRKKTINLETTHTVKLMIFFKG